MMGRVWSGRVDVAALQQELAEAKRLGKQLFLEVELVDSQRRPNVAIVNAEGHVYSRAVDRVELQEHVG